MFVLLGLASCVEGSEGSDAPGCDAYLDCLAAIDPDTFESELLVYGREGSCLEQSAPSTCNEVCLDRLESLGSSDEACEPPMQPDPTTSTTGDPEPEPGSVVDCASLGAGQPTVGPGSPGPLGFPVASCNPRSSGEGSHVCCSDDPAAEGGALPNYMGKNISGGATAFFSGMNNALGVSGMCVRVDDIPAGSGLLEPAAVDCPIPCNPTWGESDVAAVCGPSRVCCQTRELQPEDCVLEGDTWRPATGMDIGSNEVTPMTTWAPGSHATHQDPSGTGCLTFSGGQQNDAFSDCVEGLTVADQRGFCMALGPGQACPGDDPSYLDACEQINMGLIAPPGG